MRDQISMLLATIAFPVTPAFAAAQTGLDVEAAKRLLRRAVRRGEARRLGNGEYVRAGAIGVSMREE